MLEASLAFLATQVADFTVAGHHQEQFGNQAISRKVTANLFRAKDSYLLLAVNDDKQYRSLMTGSGAYRCSTIRGSGIGSSARITKSHYAKSSNPHWRRKMPRRGSVG